MLRLVARFDETMIRLLFTSSSISLYALMITMGLAGCESKNKIAIDYIGQTLPGMVAEPFALGIVSTNANEHSPMSFSPDGSVALWSVMDSKYRGRVFEIRNENGKWSSPQTPSFADTVSDYYCPSFSPDGRQLYFSSRRKAPDGYPKGRGNRIWMVDRANNEWGNPLPLDTIVSKSQEFSHSISERGTLYYSAAADGDMKIYMAERAGAGYNEPKLLEDAINTPGYEDGPYIAPDERFLIFESTRPEGIEGSHDLYICFKNGNGQWTSPLNMGPAINSPAMERFPRLSPDGKYLFFASNRDQSAGKAGFDYYWINAKVIEDLSKAATE
jgi:Tol biopolymer transport system component